MVFSYAAIYSPQRRKERRVSLFSFAGERPANEKPQPLLGMLRWRAAIFLLF
jgi:hypothetical protein